MRDLLVLGGAFALSVCALEVLVTRKLQSALGVIALVFGAGLAAALAFVRGVGVPGVLVFWSGLAACWFGVRSHIESSILINLLHRLRDGPAARDDLLEGYLRRHGEEARLDELVASGLVARTPDGILATAKGRFVARLAARLR
jgi:hypothetical protein